LGTSRERHQPPRDRQRPEALGERAQRQRCALPARGCVRPVRARLPACNEIDPAWFTEGDNIRVADEITVDLLFSPCAQTYEMLKPYEQIVDLDGVPVHTVSLEGLLLTKQTLRPQDIQDAIVLRRAIDAGG
jgi:hypothetical protein